METLGGLMRCIKFGGTEHCLVVAGARTGSLRFVTATGRFRFHTGVGKTGKCADQMVAEYGLRTGRQKKGSEKKIKNSIQSFLHFWSFAKFELITLFFRKLVVECKVKVGDPHVKNHAAPSRREVELCAFHWAIRLTAYYNHDQLSAIQIVRLIFNSWPFEHHVLFEDYRSIFLETLNNFISSLEDGSEKEKAKIQKLFAHAGVKELQEFLKFLHQDTPYWGPAKLRGIN